MHTYLGVELVILKIAVNGGQIVVLDIYDVVFRNPSHPSMPRDGDVGALAPYMTEQIATQAFTPIPIKPPPIAPLNRYMHIYTYKMSHDM